MAPTLYVGPTSAPVRAVLMVSKALNLELEQKVLDFSKGEHLTEEYLKLNPQHTVPTLVDEDRFVLWDSHAILGYLVGKYGENDDLYPQDDVKQRAVIDQRLHFDSGVLFARLQVATHVILDDVSKELSEEQIKNLQEAYSFLEKMLEGNEYVAGDDLTTADFSIVATVTSSDVLVPIDEEKFPNVKGWIKRLQMFPFYEENQNGLDAFRNLITSKLSS